MSPLAHQEMRRGWLARAIRHAIDVAQSPQQADRSDRYVGWLCLFLFGLMFGYGLATWHRERPVEQPAAHFTTPKGNAP